MNDQEMIDLNALRSVVSRVAVQHASKGVAVEEGLSELLFVASLEPLTDEVMQMIEDTYRRNRHAMDVIPPEH